LTAWERELINTKDPNTDFILSGITDGFDIVDKGAVPEAVFSRNHPSASPGSPLYGLVHDQVCVEIAAGNYIISDEQPTIVSPLCAIPKDHKSIRLIHDASYPEGKSLNDYATITEKDRYETVDTATAMMTPNCYMAKVDLASAYRSVHISESSQKFTGLQFCVNGQTVFLKDRKLSFGSRLAPHVFSTLSQAVKRMMQHRHFNVCCYLDDFLIVEDTFERCKDGFNVLITLLRDLGFMINWSKVCDPSQLIIFLGIELDSKYMITRLPKGKLEALQDMLRELRALKRISRRQLERITGRLSHATQVIHCGRAFLHSMYDAIARTRSRKSRIRLAGLIREDLNWWFQTMEGLNGKSICINKQTMLGLQTDSCVVGAAAVYGPHYCYINWSQDWPQADSLHINYKETLIVVLAAARFGPLWRKKRIIVQTDNTVTVSLINRLTAREPLVLKCVKYLLYLSVMYDFEITAVHIPGKLNYLADALSRLHEPKMFNCFPLSMFFNSTCYISDKSMESLLYRHKIALPTAAGC
jgi:hypothetical protein